MAILDKTGCGGHWLHGRSGLMYVQCKVYVQLWRRLKAYNRVIFVQNCPDTAKKQEKNFSCPANMDIKDAVVVPVSQTGAASLPAADAGPPEVVPV